MTPNEEKAQYERFRERLLYELAPRLLRESGLMYQLGRTLMKWRNELILTRVLLASTRYTPADSDETKASTGLVRYCDTCLKVRVDADAGIYTCHACIDMKVSRAT